MTEYIPALIPAFIGGIMIGTAAVLLMALKGEIMGVSGILGRLVPPFPKDYFWRMVFVIGILMTPVLYILITGNTPQVDISSNTLLLIVAGLLVGFGTITGNGCTSGHGICGLPRLSKRSIVAVCIFMLSAAITVYVVRHIFGG